MRVLYLVNVARPYLTGAALRTLTLAGMLGRTGVDVAIAGPSGSAIERAARERGIRFHPTVFRVTPWDLYRLWGVVRGEKPDIVHATSVIPLVLARPSLVLVRRKGRRRGPGLFVSILVDPTSSLVYSRGSSPGVSRFRNLLLRRVAPALNGIFTVSPSVSKILESMGVGGLKIVTGSMIDIADLERRSRAIAELPEGQPRVGTAVGQLETLKGVDHLIRAFAHVAVVHPAAVCLVAGEGGERANLVRLAADLGVGDRVHLLGYLEEPAPFIRALDVYVCPSLTEGMAGATAEALALGVPVVSTDVGGTRDLVTDNVTGLLVPPADAASMASAIERMLDDPDAALRLGAAGKADVAARYGVERVFQATLREYERVVRE